MKKQLKTTVMAIALLATVTGAFASDIANAISGKKLAPYSWQKFNRNGTPIGQPVISDTNPFPECDGSEEICAIGTDLSGGPSITVRYHEL